MNIPVGETELFKRRKETRYCERIDFWVNTKAREEADETKERGKEEEHAWQMSVQSWRLPAEALSTERPCLKQNEATQKSRHLLPLYTRENECIKMVSVLSKHNHVKFL